MELELSVRTGLALLNFGKLVGTFGKIRRPDNPWQLQFKKEDD
jgi:hypothetical protein